MDLIDDYVLTNLTVDQSIKGRYKLRSLGDEWRNKPFIHRNELLIMERAKPTFKCDRCLADIVDIHAHMKMHIDEDIAAGLIKVEKDEPMLECPECGLLMEMTFEDIPGCLPLKCSCGYKRTIKAYTDGRYLII